MTLHTVSVTDKSGGKKCVVITTNSIDNSLQWEVISCCCPVAVPAGSQFRKAAFFPVNGKPALILLKATLSTDDPHYDLFHVTWNGKTVLVSHHKDVPAKNMVAIGKMWHFNPQTGHFWVKLKQKEYTTSPHQFDMGQRVSVQAMFDYLLGNGNWKTLQDDAKSFQKVTA